MYPKSIPGLLGSKGTSLCVVEDSRMKKKEPKSHGMLWFWDVVDLINNLYDLGLLGGGPKKPKPVPQPMTYAQKCLFQSNADRRDKDPNKEINPLKNWMEKTVHATSNPPSDRTSLHLGGNSDIDSVSNYSVKSKLQNRIF